ncbi:MAG: hypothetical protein ACE5ES_00555 [Candidatus Nanoarchaeia archaeon]
MGDVGYNGIPGLFGRTIGGTYDATYSAVVIAHRKSGDGGTRLERIGRMVRIFPKELRFQLYFHGVISSPPISRELGEEQAQTQMNSPPGSIGLGEERAQDE